MKKRCCHLLATFPRFHKKPPFTGTKSKAHQKIPQRGKVNVSGVQKWPVSHPSTHQLTLPVLVVTKFTALVLGADPLFAHVRWIIGGDATPCRRHVRRPLPIRRRIPARLHFLNHCLRPIVKFDGFHAGNVSAQVAVYTAAVHANEYGQIGRCPFGLRGTTIRALVISQIYEIPYGQQACPQFLLR